MDQLEENILKGLKQGNRQVFEEIFKKHYALLCYEARGYFKSYDLIEDVVCETFTHVWLNREKLTINTSLRDYLVRSVHHKCIDYWRQLQKQQNKNVGLEEAEIASSLSGLGESPLDYILTRELEEKINKTIELLPQQYKTAFKLSRFKGLSYEEIAGEMKISVNTVKTDIKKALAFLRNELKDFIFLISLLFSYAQDWLK